MSASHPACRTFCLVFEERYAGVTNVLGGLSVDGASFQGGAFRSRMGRNMRTGLVKFVALGCSLFVGVGCSGSAERGEQGLGVSQQAQVAADSKTFSISLPSGASLSSEPAVASQTLTLGDRATVQAANGAFLPIENAGTSSAEGTELGTDTHVGAILSGPSVTLRDRSKVDGDVQSGGTVTRQNQTVVNGSVTEHSAPSFYRWSWTVNFPAASQSVSVAGGSSTPIDPGSFENVTVFSSATLRLKTGTYYLKSFDVEPQAQILVDTTQGPVVVYVRGGLIWRGAANFTGPSDRLFLGYAGTDSVALESPFVGTLAAPEATVRLAVGGTNHFGAFFAKSLQLDPGVHLTFRPFQGWDGLGITQAGQCTVDMPAAGPHSLSAKLPRGLRGPDVALHAETRLNLQNGARVLEYLGGFGPVTSSGHQATVLGSGVQTGHLFSFADVAIGTSSVIHGGVRSEGQIAFASNARATETVAAPTELEPLSAVSIAYTRPTARSAGLTVTARATASSNLNYGSTTISYGGTLQLGPGDFHFDSLSVANGGVISVDNSKGPVRIFVYGAFTYAGLIRELRPDLANVLFVVTSCTDVTLDGPFRGTLFAPFASINLKAVPAGHTGSFFGASVNLLSDATVRHHAFKRDDCAQVDDGCGNTFGCTGTRLCASSDALASVTPIGECVLARHDGTFVGRFGYNNTSGRQVAISAGSTNQLSAGSQFQPQVFEPGQHPAALYARLQGSLTWKIGTQQATISTNSPRCQGVVEGLDTPIRITGAHDNDTGANTPGTQTSTPLDFEIPKKLAVSLGGAGSGTATLTYRSVSAGLVTCTYRGGSRVPTAVKDLDRARGRFYNFVSCTNGAAAGSTATGSQWTVNVVSGDPTYSQTEVTAKLGPGCSVIDAPIPADVSIQTRQSFSWKTAQPLAEKDPTGLPALYYAWIYIERREQLDALKRMRIYHRVLPIFSSQLAAYSGKCGTLDASGDGTGIFVHALVPGAVFNLWRSVSVDVLNRGTGTIPFRVVQVMPPPEPALMNSDGLSMSWTKIKASGLIPFGPAQATQAPLFGIHVPIVDDVVEVAEDAVSNTVDLVSGVPIVGDAVQGVVQLGDQLIDTAISVAPSFDEIIESTVQLVEGAQGLITAALGTFESWLFDTVPVSISLSVLNRDVAFNTDDPMQRAWGAPRGFSTAHELLLSGMRAEVHKWGNLLLPTAYDSIVTKDGQANMLVAKGGSARGQSGFCLSLENDAAMMASGITENEFCDFRDLEYNWDFDNGTVRQLRLNDWQLHAFNQINDANHYARSVLGFAPRQAEVGVGWVANLIVKGNNDQPLTACLNYPEGQELLLEVAGGLSMIPAGGAVVGAAGVLATPFIRRDMFLPETAEPRDSRGIVTHEYGHLIMCDILHNIDRNALLRLYRDRIPEGKADSRTDDVTVQSEAFADFIMTQVAGGANYSDYLGTITRNFSNYCVTPPCVEQNFRGLSESPGLFDFNDEARRFTSLWHDAVDRKADLSRSDDSLPTNADAWVASAGAPPLSYTPTGYLTDSDDAVELPGSAIEEAWNKALDGCQGDAGDPSATCHIDPIGVQRGLANTMKSHGATWCDACQVVMSHSRLSAAVNATTVRATWLACADPFEARNILGPPPSDDLRLDAATCQPCPGGTVSDPSGQCLPCNANEVVKNNACVVCPAGSIIDSNFNCVACGPKQVSVGNTCVDCQFFQTPNRTTNTCVDCSADATIDWSTLPSMCPAEHVTVPLINAGSGDTCPDAVWVEIDNIDDAVTRAVADHTTVANFEAFVEEPIAVDKPTCQSAFTTVSVLLGSPGSWTGIGGKQGLGVWTDESCSGNVCLPGSCAPPIKVISGSEVVAGQKNMRVLGLAQRLTTGALVPTFGLLNVRANLTRSRYTNCSPG